MLFTLTLCFFLIASMVVAASYPKLWMWSLITGLLLFAGFYVGLGSPVALSIIGLLYGVAIICLHVPWVRMRFVTAPLYDIFQQQTLTMSNTEREALEAGDPWWEKDLFQGNPNWSEFKKIELSQLTEEEQSFVDNETVALCQQLDSWKIDYTDKKIPDDVLKYIRSQGFLGLHIAKEYQGKAFSSRANSCINMRVNAQSALAATVVMVCNSLGPGELITHYGTDCENAKPCTDNAGVGPCQNGATCYFLKSLG